LVKKKNKFGSQSIIHRRDMTTVTLISADECTIVVPRNVASMSKDLRYLLDEVPIDDTSAQIPIPHVQGSILRKVLDYCEKHVDRTSVDDAWRSNLANEPYGDILRMITAANHLHIPSLLDALCQWVKEQIQDKNPIEIREHFKIGTQVPLTS